jgi:trehalose 6-phosphate phosphatase
VNPLSSSNVPELAPPTPSWALFLGVEGVLLDDDPRSEHPVASHEIVDLLSRLSDAFEGAVALISGRPIAELDRIFHPLRLPCIGIHASELRLTDATVHHARCDTTFLQTARPIMGAFVAENPGANLFDNGVALSLRIPRDAEIRRKAVELVAWLAGVSGSAFALQESGSAVDLKPVTAHMGNTMVSVLAEPPFRGRRPVVVWDSLSDGGAFHSARLRDGIAIVVGSTAPPGAYEFAGPGDCRRWLEEMARLVDRV